ncbi:MAG TPA: M14 family zinc carboxypeptidase [Gaiellaceae bacterium]
MIAALAALVIGWSVEHRPIELVHVPGDGPRVLVVGCIHGNECAGMAVIRALERAHPHEDLWLVPTLNPDGLAHGTRQNAHGIDLNRNFPSGWRPFGAPWSVYASGPRPWSEPETRAARALIRRVHPQVTIWFHQHMDLVWAYGRSSRAGRRYAQLAGMRYRHWQWLAGTAANWQNHLPDGEQSFAVELPAGRLDARGLGRQVRACLRVALAAP